VTAADAAKPTCDCEPLVSIEIFSLQVIQKIRHGKMTNMVITSKVCCCKLRQQTLLIITINIEHCTMIIVLTRIIVLVI